MLSLDKIEIQMDQGGAQGVLHADFALKPGARVAVLGPSGAGKSTLLDVIAGFRAPRAGRVLWQGQDVTGSVPQTRPVSILFQDGNLFPHLTLMRNLGLALAPDGRKPDPKARTRISSALTRVGLSGYEARRPGTLSGGEQGRAALARVLLQARPILLLDEPFAALGPALKHEMLALVSEVVEDLGAVCLLVTHDPGDARHFAEAVVLLADGRAEPAVETEALFADPPEALRAYLGAG